MTFYVGTSGFAFKEWKGTFYPKELPDDELLAHYAGRLSSVEINNTFYRLPKESVVADWAIKVPETFRFAVKASQRITHYGRLKDVDDVMGYFLKVVSTLGGKRGPTLFQLPPNMKKDLPRLQAFLPLIPNRWLAAIEFRHESWFDEDVFQALRDRNVALCIADQADFEAPFVPTADWGYVRLHRLEYETPALIAWAARLREQPWEDTYVFFKHDEGKGSGPPGAEEFKQLLA
ncbi:MAG: DUF72 domain-containing protein [Gemmatimonadota bacterium]